MSPAHYRKEEEPKVDDKDEDIFDYEAIDLLHKKDPEAARKAYMKQNLASISLQEDQPETLYKMYESTKHINSRVSEFLRQEESFYGVIKKYNDLPELIKGFDHIPDQLKEDE